MTDLRDQIADAVERTNCDHTKYLAACARCRLAAVIAVAHDFERRAERAEAEAEQFRYERRLLGFARMTLDLVAAGDPNRWEQARREAEDIAQRIVDEIGHPVTDEDALGPSYREQIEQLQRDGQELGKVIDVLGDFIRDAFRQGATDPIGALHQLGNYLAELLEGEGGLPADEHNRVYRALEERRQEAERLRDQIALHEACAPATNDLARQQRARAERAEAAIERVRQRARELTALAPEAQGVTINHTAVDWNAGDAVFIAAIGHAFLAALNQPPDDDPPEDRP